MVDAVENTTSDGTGKDITNEIEADADTIEIYSIEELVPSSAPITIPYLEIYRTNELEYVPYISPYNTGVKSSSSSDSSSSATNSATTGDNQNNQNNQNNNQNNQNSQSSSGSPYTSDDNYVETVNWD